MKREVHYDLMKGLGILLVVIAHTTLVLPCRRFIASFVMMLFFFVSGVFVRANKPWKEAVWLRFKRIMVPYFAFALLSFAYWAVLERHFRPDTADISLLLEFTNIFYPMNMRVPEGHVYNVVLWFLPCLFWAVVLLDGLLRLSTRTWILLLTGTALALFCQWTQFELPFYLLVALSAMPFLILGSLEGRYREQIRRVMGWNRWLTVVVAVGCLYGVQAWARPVEMRFNVFEGGYLLQFGIACLGVFGVYALSSFVSGSRLIEWLGVHSLGIMLIHDPIKRIFAFLLSKASGFPVEALRTSFVGTAAVVAATLGVCVVLIIVYDRAKRLVFPERAAQ